jgi:ABC-2 type transport system ATP-binding protein
MTTMIDLQDVWRAYGKRSAVAGVSLRVDAGSVVAIAGPNGSGKTTLTRIAGGFAAPDRGAATVAGMSALAYRERHGVGFVPEETSRGFARARVRDVLAFRLRNGDAPPSAVAHLGIDRLLDSRTESLSKGQWRLVLMACALAGASRVLVLDEPDAGLDPGALDRLATAIAAAAAAGAAILLASHHLELIARVADQILFMSGGRIAGSVGHVGNTSELRQFYITHVGDMA